MLYDRIIPAFLGLSAQLQLFNATLTDANDIAVVESILAKTSTLAATIERSDVEDFYFYYVTRGLYAELGVRTYLERYKDFQLLIGLCNNETQRDDLVCPPLEVTPGNASTALLAHADNVFSNITTAGAPFPFWSLGDGTGTLFEGTSPVSGSGVDMSAPLDSLSDYFAYLQQGGVFDPITPNANWTNLVERNPIYSWFTAGLTEADNGKSNTICCSSGISMQLFC